MNCRAFSRLIGTTSAFLTAVLLATPAVAGDRNGDRPERERKLSEAKIAPLALKERETLTVALAPVEKNVVPLRVQVRFLDETGKEVAVRKGRIASKATFVAKLTHDELGRLDPALIRTDIRLLTAEPIAAGVSCGLLGSGQTSDGPILVWKLQPCLCGQTEGNNLFFSCQGIGGITTGRNE